MTPYHFCLCLHCLTFTDYIFVFTSPFDFNIFSSTTNNTLTTSTYNAFIHSLSGDRPFCEQIVGKFPFIILRRAAGALKNGAHATSTRHLTRKYYILRKRNIFKNTHMKKDLEGWKTHMEKSKICSWTHAMPALLTSWIWW